MTSESKARQVIDRKLSTAGGLVQDFKQLNLGASMGVVFSGQVVAQDPGERTAQGASKAPRGRKTKTPT